MKVSEALIDRTVEEIRERNGLPRSTCKYDWQKGFRGSRLRCVVHKHAQGTDTVIVGSDILADMLRHGCLTGMALDEARKTVQLPRRVTVTCPHCRGEKVCSCFECAEGFGEGFSAKCRTCDGIGEMAQWLQ